MGKIEQLRDRVREAYSAVAQRPQDEHPFPVGRRFAESICYPQDVLAGLPSVAVDAFTGVSNVSVFADIPPGVTVLDLGCGAGLDSLIAARRTGPEGKVVGVDFSHSMLVRACQAAAELGIDNAEFHHAEVENLPIGDGVIDVALLNGIFNLNPARHAIFQELARVMRPGGTVYAAELILIGPLPPEILESEINWFR